MSNTVPVTLRDRQRTVLRQEIVAAAMNLFESQGFRSTTVEEVARAVGISARTVFRHFPTKEDLVLSWLPRAEEFLQSTTLTGTEPRLLIRQFEAALADGLAEHAELASKQVARSFRRFRKLISTDPDLRHAISTWSNRLDELAYAKLSSQLGPATDELGIRLLIQLIAAPLNAALSTWAHQPDSDLAELYASARQQRDAYLGPAEQAGASRGGGRSMPESQPSGMPW